MKHKHLSLDQVLPAPGQGALGLQMHADNPLKSYVSALNHAPTQAAVQAERQLLQTLRAGCHAPVGAWARLEEDQLTLDGLVGHPDGTEMLRARHSAPLTDAQPLGEAAAAALREQGADALLQAE